MAPSRSTVACTNESTGSHGGLGVARPEPDAARAGGATSSRADQMPTGSDSADEITAPNSDDGVGRVLERWWL